MYLNCVSTGSQLCFNWISTVFQLYLKCISLCFNCDCRIILDVLDDIHGVLDDILDVLDDILDVLDDILNDKQHFKCFILDL